MAGTKSGWRIASVVACLLLMSVVVGCSQNSKRQPLIVPVDTPYGPVSVNKNAYQPIYGVEESGELDARTLKVRAPDRRDAVAWYLQGICEQQYSDVDCKYAWKAIYHMYCAECASSPKGNFIGEITVPPPKGIVDRIVSVAKNYCTREEWPLPPGYYVALRGAYRGEDLLDACRYVPMMLYEFGEKKALAEISSALCDNFGTAQIRKYSNDRDEKNPRANCLYAEAAGIPVDWSGARVSARQFSRTFEESWARAEANANAAEAARRSEALGVAAVVLPATVAANLPRTTPVSPAVRPQAGGNPAQIVTNGAQRPNLGSTPAQAMGATSSTQVRPGAAGVLSGAPAAPGEGGSACHDMRPQIRNQTATVTSDICSRLHPGDGRGIKGTLFSSATQIVACHVCGQDSSGSPHECGNYLVLPNGRTEINLYCSARTANVTYKCALLDDPGQPQCLLFPGE